MGFLKVFETDFFIRIGKNVSQKKENEIFNLKINNAVRALCTSCVRETSLSGQQTVCCRLLDWISTVFLHFYFFQFQLLKFVFEQQKIILKNIFLNQKKIIFFLLIIFENLMDFFFFYSSNLSLVFRILDKMSHGFKKLQLIVLSNVFFSFLKSQNPKS